LFHIYSIFNDLCQTNYLNITPPIFSKLWLWMNDLPLVSLSLKGSRRGDQFLSVLSNSIHKIRLRAEEYDGLICAAAMRAVATITLANCCSLFRELLQHFLPAAAY